jgi:tetratricopeptide (TPR) repeat protein
MGQVAYERGSIDEAQKLYREALTGTAEAVRRNPTDPQRLFDHAQNVFWIADIARERGQLRSAEFGMREYKRLADRMVSLAPDNMKWRMEQQSADTNLGVFLFEQRRFPEAISQFERASQHMQALITADPSNAAYQKAATELQTWLADAVESQGRLEDARALGERNVSLIRQLLNRTGDVEYRQKLVPAERLLGEAYMALGNTSGALSHFQSAVAESELLVASEPANSRWKSFSARARLNLAEGLLTAGNVDQAAAQTEAACQITQRLQSTDASVQTWRAIVRDCWQTRSQVSVARGDLMQAAQAADRAVRMGKAVRTTNPVDDSFKLAQSYLLLGDVRAKLHNVSGAQEAWQAGLAAIPANVAEKPVEIADHAELLKRLGRSETGERTAKLGSMGYRKLS